MPTRWAVDAMQKESSYWPGPSTVSTNSLDSILPSPVQMAPSASQSVVAGRVMATLAVAVRPDRDQPA